MAYILVHLVDTGTPASTTGWGAADGGQSRRPPWASIPVPHIGPLPRPLLLTVLIKHLAQKEPGLSVLHQQRATVAMPSSHAANSLHRLRRPTRQVEAGATRVPYRAHRLPLTRLACTGLSSSVLVQEEAWTGPLSRRRGLVAHWRARVAVLSPRTQFRVVPGHHESRGARGP